MRGFDDLRQIHVVLLLCRLASYAADTWSEPSRDVRPNSWCNPAAATPSIEFPKDVTELHPAHLKYAMAIGDSITAAALSEGGPLEYRTTSWSGGAGTEKFLTMPYYVKQYSGNLSGPSLGEYQAPQLASCCGKSPWWSPAEAWDDQLNVALSGGLSADWELQVQHLTALVTGKGFGVQNFGGFPSWSNEKQLDYKSNWKVLTIFLGMNDVLATGNACSDVEADRVAIVDRYNNTMHALFDHLATDPDGVFQKLYVNLGMLFATSNLGIQNQRYPWCQVSGASFLKSEFPCMRSGGDVKAKGKLLDDVTAQMNEVLKEIAAEYDQKRPDFGVNLFQSAANQQILHEDFRVDLDCFHPTAKAHRVLGTALWNSMLKPSWPQRLDNFANVPACATSDTRLVTYSQANSEARSGFKSVIVTAIGVVVAILVSAVVIIMLYQEKTNSD